MWPKVLLLVLGAVWTAALPPWLRPHWLLVLLLVVLLRLLVLLRGLQVLSAVVLLLVQAGLPQVRAWVNAATAAAAAAAPRLLAVLLVRCGWRALPVARRSHSPEAHGRVQAPGAPEW